LFSIMDTRLTKFVLDFGGRLALPIASYAGLEITGESVEDLFSIPGAQFKSVMALADRYRIPVLITAIDPTAEAEAYGCEIAFSDREAPRIVGRLVTTAAEAAGLPDPVPGDARTRVPIETAWRLTAEVGESVPVLGTMLGPFALASRLFGVEEALAAAAGEPETVETLLDNVTGFLCRYALEFRETGAWGVLVAEDVAGRLTPGGLGRFSAPFLKRIVKAVETADFTVVIQHVRATNAHLEGLLGSGASAYWLGPAVDAATALGRVEPGTVLGGTLDPVAIFQKGTPQTVGEATLALLEATRGARNFVVSTGGDIPPGAPLANLNAFYRTVGEFNK
jgi:uroporphyrinogen decarboxylase